MKQLVAILLVCLTIAVPGATKRDVGTLSGCSLEPGMPIPTRCKGD